MVVNLNPAVKAKINQASSIVPPPVKPTVQPTTVVSWWPIETANALKNITQPATSPIPSSTTNTTTPTTWLPVKSTVTAPTTTPTPVKSGLPIFGTTASQQNATDNTYLDTRNTWLATDYSAKGIKDKESIYNELSKNADFAAATEEDKQHTADEIFKKMGTVQPTDTTTTPIKTDDIPAATDTYATLSEAEQNNPWLSTLSETEKQAYAMMSDIEKKQFINIGRNDLKNTATYIARRKEAKKYATDTNAIQTDIRNNQWEINDIQSSTRLRQAWQQLDNLKKNIAYLGTMWAPGVSTQRMDAVGKQLAEGEKIYADLVRTEKLQKEMFDSGSTLTAMQMEREMQTLQDQLDDKVGKAMQDAMAWLSAADIKWQLDTVEEIDAFRKNLVTSLDNTITGITDDNIKARQFLIERFDKIWQDMRTDIENKQKAQVEYQKNANTVNVDMSAAQWVYTDGNGNAIIDKTTNAPIEYKKWLYPPIFDKDSGMMVTFDREGNPNKPIQFSQPQGKVVSVDQFDEFGTKTWEKNFLLMPDGTTKAINFPWQSNTWPDSIPTPWETPITWKDTAPILATDPRNITEIAENMKEWQQYDCWDRWQCGEWFNDAIGNANKMHVDDSWESKKDLVKSSIEWKTGMGVVFNPWWEYKDNWHIGILSSWLYEKNGVKWYDVVSANYHGNEKLSKDFVSADYINWHDGWFIPLKATSTEDTINNTTLENKPTTSSKASVLDIYQALTENGMSDAVAKKNAKTLAQSGKTIEEIRKQYPNKAATEEITNLRKEFDNLPEVKDYKKVNNYINTIKKQASSASAAWDLSLIFAYMKLLDPNSTVREWEFANAQNAWGIDDKVINAYNKAKDGTRLNESQRKDFVNSANIEYSNYQKIYNDKLDDYKWYVTKWWDTEQIGRKSEVESNTTEYKDWEYVINGKTYVKKWDKWFIK